MKRITRDRRLTREEAAKYQAIREQVAEELPDLIARHHERMASLDQLEKLFTQLKAAREAKGLSLADLTELTGMDRSALSKFETGGEGNAGQLAFEIVGELLAIARMVQDAVNVQISEGALPPPALHRDKGQEIARH